MRRDEPKHPAARTVALLALAVLGFSAPAAPVTGEQARMAARNWLRAANPLATGLGRDVAGVQAENEAEAPYYVAALAAGGFVVLSSDDEIEPVLAFSDEGAFPSDAAAAVRELLARDMRGRARAAEAAGVADKVALRDSIVVKDDHSAFYDAGYPALELIDFDYGSARGKNDYWHTPHDTMDKVSEASLLASGRLVVELLNRLAYAPAPAPRRPSRPQALAPGGDFR